MFYKNRFAPEAALFKRNPGVKDLPSVCAGGICLGGIWWDNSILWSVEFLASSNTES